MSHRLYFDYMATTPVDPSVAEVMQACLTIDGCFANPASVSHLLGQQALAKVETARDQVAALINADSSEIIWTSGATEADNLALIGAARFYQRKGKHIITLATEHKAVIDSCEYLKKEGFDVTYLKPKQNGLLDLSQLAQAIRPDTVLVSVMHVNNEIGVIQDLNAIAELIKAKGIIFHVDAAQSLGKIPIDVQKTKVDLMAFSAHKLYGPKGIGALYVRRQPRVRLQPLIYGGGHEQGLRSGTLATHQIAGFGEACRIAKHLLPQEMTKLAALRDQLWQGIKTIDQVVLNGDSEQRIPGNLNISFADVDGEALLYALSDLAVSTASACTSASIQPSYVLTALGVPDQLAHSSIRFSVGRFTREQDIEKAIELVRKQVTRLRQLAPDG